MPPETDYEVGKGNPPKHSRWKPGDPSPNPKGRPRGSKNSSTLLDQALDEKVTMTDKGQRRNITKREAMCKQIANRAAQGDPKATQTVLRHDQEKDRRRAEQKQADPPAVQTRCYVVILPHNGREPLDPELKKEYVKTAIRFHDRKEREAALLKAANENVEEETSNERGQAA